MKSRAINVALYGLLLSGLIFLTAYSTMQSYDIPRWTVDGGGGMSSGGGYTLAGTIGQPDAGSALSGGGFVLVGGYWQGMDAASGSGIAYLPLVAYNYGTYAYAAPCGPANDYCEEQDGQTTDGWQTAYGPLHLGVDYQAYPDDSTDYYFFELSGTDNVTIRQQNYQATGDLILYRNRTGDEPEYVANWGQGGSAMTLTQSLVAAKYYVRVYTTDGHNSSELYELNVNLD